MPQGPVLVAVAIGLILVGAIVAIAIMNLGGTS